MPDAFLCLTCRDLPGVEAHPMGPDAADEHEEQGHDVRRLPDRHERDVRRSELLDAQKPRGKRERVLDGQGKPRADY